MSKQKHIKIPLPKLKWWQFTIMIVAIILASKAEPTASLISLLKIISLKITFK